jgi:3-hydroxyisobutyrate dehydrogenase
VKVGFVGIGHMGEPMARNLLRAGIGVRVWNRTPEKCRALLELGAEPAGSVQDLFKRSTVVLLMLLDSDAMDAVLGRGTPSFATRVAGKVLVHLGTTSPEYSARLERDVVSAGGAYVEAPVSGSRGPAEQGQLVGMVAGQDAAVDTVLPLLSPLCARVFRCGQVPGALRMKLAANHYLIGMVTVLAETAHAARHANVDLRTLREVLDAGPMASTVSRTKLDKLVRGDFSAQAAIRDVSTIAELVLHQSAGDRNDTPLIRQCAALYRAALAAGHGDADMAAVVHAFHPPRARGAKDPHVDDPR